MSPQKSSKTALSYSRSGVDIDAGNALVERIKPVVKKTFRPGVLQGPGGFGALFELPAGRYRSPVLVSGTDGVGTKLKLAGLLNRHDTIGIDLVAMCVNDIITCGAEPLYFLDYFATGKLDVAQAETIINGIVRGCARAGCALIGGETAEMPGVYACGDYDLAGFAVGVVEKNDMITPQRVRAGDTIIGLGSSGPHANGYSLIRKIIDVNGSDLNREFEGTTLGEALLAPTRIYVKTILALLAPIRVTAIAHITGGGLPDNLPRVLPPGVGARISRSSWSMPAVFKWLQDSGRVEQAEMLRTFNCGIGMVVCVDSQEADMAITRLENSGETVFVLGEIVESDGAAVMLTD